LLVFDVPMLNKIFGFKRNQVTRGCVEWHGFELRNAQNTDGEIEIWQA
jgi:hypothetical protein